MADDQTPSQAAAEDLPPTDEQADDLQGGKMSKVAPRPTSPRNQAMR